MAKRVKDLPNFWSRSTPQYPKVIPGGVFPDTKPLRRTFTASYESDPCKPPMALLLGWEYGRIWLQERDQFLKDSRIKQKSKIIKPDFSAWLAKRNVVLDRRKLFKQRMQKLGRKGPGDGDELPDGKQKSAISVKTPVSEQPARTAGGDGYRGNARGGNTRGDRSGQRYARDSRHERNGYSRQMYHNGTYPNKNLSKTSIK